jgi:hypothetical protein
VGPTHQWGKRPAAYPFGSEAVLGRGGFNGWADLVPLALFFLFYFFFLFLFSDFHFFHIICKNASNQFKPLLEIF